MGTTGACASTPRFDPYFTSPVKFKLGDVLFYQEINKLFQSF